jgi:ATP-binding cassette subfamily C (CFTR/MRP) protein 1
LKNEKETLPTRILVTHHVHVLPMCDIVYVLDEGKVVEKGTYDELIQRGVDIAGAVEFEKEQNEVSDEDETKDKTNDFEKNNSNGLKSSTNVKGIDAGSNNKAATFDKLTSKEERATGSIDFSAYLNYARIGGYLATIFTILAQGVGRGFEIGSAFWLSYWSSQMIDENDTRSTQYYLNIYALISMCAVFMQLIRSLLLARHRLKASTTLHENLTKSILSAPVSFFDITPIGRILNRFASDMDKVDLELSGSLSQAISTVFSIIGAVTAISAATKGIFLLPLMPLGAAYYYLQRWFRSSSTELQRLVSITASPIFVDFSETLNGITSIRAYDLQSAFFDTTLKNFDINNIAYTTLQHANSWLGLRLDALGGFIAAFVGGLSLATYSSGSSSAFIPAGWLGLSLTYSNELSQYLKHGVRMLAQVEAEMSSVERILYYSDSIDSEAPRFISNVDDVCEKSSWPQNGNITFENVSLRYRDGPLILKQLSLDIKSGERIGVVGRTGSGKSSLMNALFRIVELAEGKIIISGLDVSKLGTNILRSNLSIIPQDPVLFNNTIRYNIDPFKITTDDEIWHILRQVQLDEVVSNLEHKLEEVVAEGGENFSQGQRQLICIARALLRKPKILIMDEATASIDNATDALIQQMIRANFVGATILTIAHRLNTIMDSDRILVLEDGNVAEFDTPNTLMSISEGGVFKALVEKSRRSMRVSSRTNLASSI